MAKLVCPLAVAVVPVAEVIAVEVDAVGAEAGVIDQLFESRMTYKSSSRSDLVITHIIDVFIVDRHP